ncbi:MULTISPECIES: phosphoenolpyruvate--protein phosphotransferase [Paracoccus]|jgi:phosphotransferase system enzyme I (PtsP)|uniref:phosphoenolpyruvate--protein phosphotransferase n=2 Tax=Paracoccus TaxID=265 RepID=A0A5C4R4L7_9RHOB|nr:MULTISPECIES: phosphoenolpyruvate--protein phosphotransferase [Paracoccus]AZY93245.1 phosphoenolpyruvate--protein phosphotransferase [Paracoccus sp. Arc7-R13]TNB94369.1 phosphoenolpyruvate--protein phosphotransferase [Paracoccus marcusii]TNH38855.1 phosphoenolpyruvate--protein phosphotransferase [Paracoccus haeundaensis]WDA11323.1 phosphoenolpyruvate--protein phosphotransferase [Paracoccus marcusii]
MQDRTDSDSRKLLKRLKEILAAAGGGQDRLDQITHHIADSMGTEVCSIYLFRDADTLELCATEGLRPEAVHQTRLRLGEGLVGRVARTGRNVNTANAPAQPGFRFMPETGEEVFPAFLGVPIQRVGERLGVLVVQCATARQFSEDEVYGLEVVAMVLAEMTELGAFQGSQSDSLPLAHRFPLLVRGATGQEGVAEGRVWLHEARVVIANPVGDDPDKELARLHEGVETLRETVDRMLGAVDMGDGDHAAVLETYRMFAHSRSWLKRMEEDIRLGLSAEAAVEKEQSGARARLEMAADPYLRDRLHDLDDLSNRLLRILTGQGHDTGAEMPERPILVARNIGPAELLEYGRRLKGVVLEEGSVGSHAAIVARALAIPLVIHATRITTEALNGDPILVDGDQGVVHLRPEETVHKAFLDKIAMQAEAQDRYADLRDQPATGTCGTTIQMFMNAGLMADLPSLEGSGAEGVGLFRTELQFLVRSHVPRRAELAGLYARVMDNAQGKPVMFRTLDIGSDKVLPYMKPQDEPNPAMGWRAIRVGLDKRGVLRMQLQALIRASVGRPLHVMFPFIADITEYEAAHRILMQEMAREQRLGHSMPSDIRVGAMLETPSLAFAPKRFFEMCDFISIGGNDLKQFFFAADRENERVRRRYDTLNVSFLSMLRQIIARCADARVPLSFCGEDAGRPVEALVFAALGIHRLSMRPASIGPVKHLIRRISIVELARVIEEAEAEGLTSVRGPVTAWLARQ